MLEFITLDVGLCCLLSKSTAVTIFLANTCQRLSYAWTMKLFPFGPCNVVHSPAAAVWVFGHVSRHSHQ